MTIQKVMLKAVSGEPHWFQAADDWCGAGRDVPRRPSTRFNFLGSKRQARSARSAPLQPRSGVGHDMCPSPQ